MTIVLASFIILLTATGQVFLKLGAQLNTALFLNKYVMTGYGIFVVVVCLSMALMSYLPLKYISIIVSFSYPATILFAGIFLGERITRKTFVACCVIVAGCIVFNL